jgi:ubiquinone biosynthesis protein Coq4
MTQEVQALFRQHDAGHVLFGCDTSLRGETLIDTWTIFGTTAGLGVYLASFQNPQVKRTFREVGYGRIVVALFRCLPDVLRVIARSRRLARKWPWSEWEAHLDRPLAELRREHDIAVV